MARINAKRVAAYVLMTLGMTWGMMLRDPIWIKQLNTYGIQQLEVAQ